MLHIKIPPKENYWDEINERFLSFDGCEILLEHSLYTVCIWEGITHKAFVGTEKNDEDLLLYMRCMCVNDVPDMAFNLLTQGDFERIQEYISDDQTATTFSSNGSVSGASKKKEVITSEVLYYLMISRRIPIEFQHWHFGRLMVLLRVFSEKDKEAELAAKRKNGGKGKSRISAKEQNDLARKYHDLNERRKRELNTRG